MNDLRSESWYKSFKDKNTKREELINKLNKLDGEDLIPFLMSENINKILTYPDGGVECPRCYCIHTFKMNYDNLCDMCCYILIDDYPNHISIPFIKEAYKLQKEYYSRKPSNVVKN
jgi:hypothetical protein